MQNLSDSLNPSFEQENLSWLTNAEEDFALNKSVFAFVQKQVLGYFCWELTSLLYLT
jgi:hypothetical protein